MRPVPALTLESSELWKSEVRGGTWQLMTGGADIPGSLRDHVHIPFSTPGMHTERHIL